MKKGDISVVTGASSGLGRDTAKLLCEKGLVVYVIARSKDKLIELQKECSEEKGKIKIISGDLTNSGFRKRLVSKIIRESKKVDYFINNAGYGKLVNFENEELKDVEGMFQLNIIVQEHLTQLILPYMKKRKKGRIINISSVVVFTPPTYFSTYNATKSAVYNFSRTLSYELKKTGVSISVVFPARMKTPFWIVAFKCKGLKEGEQKMCREKWTKSAGGSLPVAKYIVKNLDSERLTLLPGLRPRLFYFLRHFPRIVDFFSKKFILSQTKEILGMKK